ATTSAAASRLGTGRQSSPVTGLHAGRCSRSSGTSTSAQAAAACAVIVEANGCVASTTASVPWARNHSATPSTPRKPPTRTVPGSGRGERTRPASETVTSWSTTSSPASTRASVVPPSRSTLTASSPPSPVRVEGAVREVLGGQRGSDDHDRGHPDARLAHLLRQRRQGPPQHHLVLPAGERDDRGRAVGPVDVRHRGDDLVDAVDGQVQHQGAARA